MFPVDAHFSRVVDILYFRGGVTSFPWAEIDVLWECGDVFSVRQNRDAAAVHATVAVA